MKLATALFASALLAPGLAFGADSSLAPQEQERTQHQQQKEQKQKRDKNLEDRHVQKMQLEAERSDSETDEQEYLAPIAVSDVSVEVLIGSDVKSHAGNENIGTVDDILVDQDNQPMAALISVGSFLGIGEKIVAIGWESVQVMQKQGADEEYVLVVDVSSEALEDSPGFDGDEKD